MHILNSILKPLCLLDRSTLALANLTAIHLHLTNWTLILSLCRDLQILLPLVQAFSSSIRAFSCHLHISLVSVYSLIRTVSTTSNFQLWISSIPSKNFSKQTCCSSNINVTYMWTMPGEVTHIYGLWAWERGEEREKVGNGHTKNQKFQNGGIFFCHATWLV